MARAVFTPTLLLAVLIQAAFGCFWRHSHEPALGRKAQPTVSADHGHHHGRGHHHHGDHHAPPPAHFHFGGEGDENHQHEPSADDSYSYVAARFVDPPTSAVAWFGHVEALTAAVSRDAEPTGWRERSDAFGRSGWPSGQRLSLLGVLVV